MATDSLIWHYTARLESNLGGIISDGIIDIDEMDPSLLPLGFVPCVWCSANQHWEAISSKLPWSVERSANGRTDKVPTQEGLQIAARIGVLPEETPWTWEQWKLHALSRLIHRKRRDRAVWAFSELTRRAIRAGGDVSQWRASPSPIPISAAKAIQIYLDDKWVDWNANDPDHHLISSITTADGQVIEVIRKFVPGEGWTSFWQKVPDDIRAAEPV